MADFSMYFDRRLSFAAACSAGCRRCVKYKSGSGFHDLNMLIGGSVGFGGEYRLMVDEGKFPDRHWSPFVTLNDDIKAIADAIVFETTSPTSPTLNDKEQKVLDVLAAHAEGITQKTIRNESTLNTKSVSDILKKLIEERYVVETEEKGKNGKAVAHYHLAAQPEE